MISSRQYWLSLEIAGVLALGILSASGIQLSTENGEVPSGEETPLQRGEVFKLSSGELTEVAHDSDSAFTASPQESNNFSLALPTASSLVRINLKGPLSITLTGALGETVKMNLSHFILRGDSVLTLAGTATTTFVIRIRNRFSLSQSSKVVLADGLLPENVVFHVLGKGDAVTLNKQTTLQGMVVAHHRRVRLSGHAIIFGQVLAKRLRLRDASQIIWPPVVSP